MEKTHSVKFTILPFLRLQFHHVKHIHIVMLRLCCFLKSALPDVHVTCGFLLFSASIVSVLIFLLLLFLFPYYCVHYKQHSFLKKSSLAILVLEYVVHFSWYN